jgi:hypothetical protein
MISPGFVPINQTPVLICVATNVCKKYPSNLDRFGWENCSYTEVKQLSSVGKVDLRPEISRNQLNQNKVKNLKVGK